MDILPPLPPPRFVPPIPICDIFENDEVKMREFKEEFLQMSPDEIYELVKIKFKHFNVENEQIKYELNVLVIIYGFLSNYLSDYCTIIIKGGKVIQQWYKTSSTDVDIMIIPLNPSMDDSYLVKIAEYICDFVLWVKNDNLSVKKPLDGIISEKTVYKISKQMGPGYFIALSDIGIGYNHLNDYIKTLYTSEICPHEILEKNLKFNTLCSAAFIKEKIFYVSKYNYLLQNGLVQNPIDINNMIYFIRKANEQLGTLEICEDIYKDSFNEMLVEAINGATDELIKMNALHKKDKPTFKRINTIYFHFICSHLKSFKKMAKGYRRTKKNNHRKKIRKSKRNYLK